MTYRTELMALIQEKASRGGFSPLDSIQQDALMRISVNSGSEPAAKVDTDIIPSRCDVWAAPFGMIMLHEVEADCEADFNRHVLAAESYLDLLLLGEETPGKVMDGYLILDLTRIASELRALVTSTEQNTRLVRKHCVWHGAEGWQRVDRISVLALTDNAAYTDAELPPGLDEEGRALIEALEEMTARKLAALHASEWE
ncbi:hypothetical protein [Pectobacterium odoriferum]|uniref:hypothetical protein n=1 Tax=Pectobacterium odoriferum TaxID=78398 RepID=UPI000CD1A6C4|nr:hypothetical protein [Pectobacterium odoriferum]POE37825.1 hypothetical protein BV920_19830 [Pectobacterium odoriferum]